MPRRFIPPEQKELLLIMNNNGMHDVDIARYTDISERTVRRVKKLYREYGRVYRRPFVCGRPRALGALPLAYLEALIEQTSDMTLSELRQALILTFGIDVTERTIAQSLKRRGYTRKMLTRPALEAIEADRAAFQLRMAQYQPEQLVFLDEAANNRHTVRRRYGWAPAGDRARRHDYFVRATRYSVLPAISLSGVLYVDIITRAWNGELFSRYLDTLLLLMNPYPGPNSVLVMDNVNLHHFEGVRDKIEARGCRLEYLSAYSPDFNPCEEAFSCMKAWLRCNRDFVLGEMSGVETCDPFALLTHAVFDSMTPSNIRSWFRDSGYVAD